eukprot:COSAG04_NODE_10353_length_784_cov_1.163504_2_plen_74_part_00
MQRFGWTTIVVRLIAQLAISQRQPPWVGFGSVAQSIVWVSIHDWELAAKPISSVRTTMVVHPNRCTQQRSAGQ